MFCPKCATPNGDDAKFCRACGADISLVPQAVAGLLAERLAAGEESRVGRRRHRHRGDKGPPSIERAVRHLFMGVAFIFLAFAVRTWAPAGNIWWFWMLLPAASMLADGVSSLLRMSEERKRRESLSYTQTTLPPRYASPLLPPRDTGEMIPPPSVTEATTRHLGVPVERERGER